MTEINDHSTILAALLAGETVSDSQYLELKEALKPVFFTQKGFMNWRWDEVRERTKLDVAYRGERLLEKDYDSLDELVVEFTSYASALYQGRQGSAFFDNDEQFPYWPAERVARPALKLTAQIRSALESTGRARERAIILIAQFAERSSSQSRKSIAGNVAQDAVELVLRSAGLNKSIGYGTQFRFRGSDTDFIVPFAAHGDVSAVRAFIAVQSSTNDRARLSSSELHRGADRYLVSLNGCPASPKSTTDIGDELVGKYIEDENFYVIIDSERRHAVQDATTRLNKAKSSGGIGLDNSRRRIRWLQNYAINFDEFAERIKRLVEG
jgi:hypothetical protein